MPSSDGKIELSFVVTDANRRLPLFVIRGAVLYPHATMPVTGTDDQSTIRAGQRVVVIASLAGEGEDPLSRLATIGTEAVIAGPMKMGQGEVNGLVLKGLRRVAVRKFSSKEVTFDVLAEPEQKRTPRFEARFRALRMLVRKLAELNPSVTQDTEYLLNAIDDPGALCDLVAPFLSLPLDERLELLAEPGLHIRVDRLIEHLGREVELLKMASKIHDSARNDLKAVQKRNYIIEQIRTLKNELNEIDGSPGELDSFEEQLESRDFPYQVREVCEREIERMDMMPPGSPEYMVSHSYISWLLDLPWDDDPIPAIPSLEKARKQLDRDHFGLEKVKEKVLEYLAVMKHQDSPRGEILLLSGPPGVGKTSLAKSIAAALGRPYQRISLGGVKDEAEIRGHRRTYIGSMPGKIIHAIKNAGTSAPVILLDEIDKIGYEHGRGDLGSALLEVLDPEQNKHFTDHYLGVQYDLSRVIFICTANTTMTLSEPLLDRMEVIELSSYTEVEKLSIATRYLVPRIRKNLNITAGDMRLGPALIRQVIRQYTREAGVRQLQRELTTIGRKTVKGIVSGHPLGTITAKDLHTWLGHPRYLEEARESTLIPGVAIGLAYTSVGGDIMYVETSRNRARDGKGRLHLTGSLGNVMKESAHTVVSYLSALVDSESNALGLDPKALEDNHIHLHFPDGATPKDGPSAGIAIMCAITSLLTGRPLPSDLAMTGEVTLRGQVLPVGGIREKLLAAHRYGKTKVLLPAQNEKDLEEIPAEIRSEMEITLVKTMQEVLVFAGLVESRSESFGERFRLRFPLGKWQPDGGYSLRT